MTNRFGDKHPPYNPGRVRRSRHPASSLSMNVDDKPARNFRTAELQLVKQLLAFVAVFAAFITLNFTVEALLRSSCSCLRRKSGRPADCGAPATATRRRCAGISGLLFQAVMSLPFQPPSIALKRAYRSSLSADQSCPFAGHHRHHVGLPCRRFSVTSPLSSVSRAAHGFRRA